MKITPTRNVLGIFFAKFFRAKIIMFTVTPIVGLNFQAWDDVERKVKPAENPYEYKKRIMLDQEKSKQSLGEIYEQEYLKQQVWWGQIRNYCL